MRVPSSVGRALCSLFALTVMGCGRGDAPKIILFIADGAGVAHWTLARFATSDLAVTRMPVVGLVDTRGHGHTVSGSAPTATAYSTGLRTFMGAVGVGPDSIPAETVVEAAIARGMATGLVTTTWLVDATPAAFGAHSVTRSALGAIARQMATAGIRVLMGGGRRAFEPALQPDSVNFLAEVQHEYTYVADADQLRALNPDTVNALLALLAEGDMGIVEQRGATTFRDMVSTALRIVSRESNGFFMMIENEESDTQAHGNAGEDILVAEMLDFDNAVGIALDYQAEHPDVLVLVTGDHETGGITLPHDQDRNAIMTYSTQSHTGALIPIFAAGPGAERFGGILDNYRVGELLMDIVRQR